MVNLIKLIPVKLIEAFGKLKKQGIDLASLLFMLSILIPLNF